MNEKATIVLIVFGMVVVPRGAAADGPLTYGRFRVVEHHGRVAAIAPMATENPPRWARDVIPAEYDWPSPGRDATPYFAEPIPFVVPPEKDSGEPLYSHNHCPDIAWLPNGDLLVVWFSTIREQGTEMTILASRLRAGHNRWDRASEFFKAEGRNMTGSSLFHDGKGLLHHVNGMGREGVEGWADLAMLHRYSLDHGVTWSVARPISSGAVYRRRHQVIAGLEQTRDGVLIQPCDATPGGQGSTALHISLDGGRTWSDPGGDIRGIHAGVVELKDGRLMALGRGQTIDGRMPMSLSCDMGRTWTYRASTFPPIGAAQRLVLMRLHEGPLLFVSFTGLRSGDGAMTFLDESGADFQGVGLFAALSHDEGVTWPVRRLLTPGERRYEVGPYFGAALRRPPVIETTSVRAEVEGYLAATQSPDGVIHLVSSRLHYRFNLAWLQGCPRPKWQGRTLSNSLGMEMIRIEPGTFLMGSEEVYKERPVHRVHITQPFHMSATQVTNQQYEQFDAEHRALRGKFGLSKEDDEAVLFVSWHDAVGFCEWLSQEEGVSYRLPTEAEWEYAARAGTTTKYNTGDTLPTEFHRNQRPVVGAQAVPLHVGRTPPNAWGLYDMHGLVEEWVYDWYGPYTPEEKTDPVGRKDGTVKVTRGGSHGTPLEFLRSATRLGTLPEDRSWLIGFRVVRAEMPDTAPLSPEEPRKWARDIKQVPQQWGSETAEPYFARPQSFVRIPRGSVGPVYCRFADLEIRTNHVNHMPAVAWLDNGDLFVVWYSTTGSGSTVLMRIDLDEDTVEFSQGQTAGIHATAVQLKDGRMLAVGRTAGDTDNWDASKLPISLSHDGGNTWEYFDSEFPAIGHGQRPVLMRLREGPLLLISFAGRRSGEEGMLFADKDGRRFRGYRMFAALSFDEGETWPTRKRITPADGKTYDGQGATRYFTATHTQAEHRGYLTATQTPDGVVHLLSSGLHYRFNLAWVRQ